MSNVETLTRQRNLAEEALAMVETERLQAVRERDEARAVARKLMTAVDYDLYLSDWGYLPGSLWQDHPWLQILDDARDEALDE